MSRGVFVRFEEPYDEWALRTLLLRFVINLAGLFIASRVVPGLVIGDWQSLVAGTAIFAIVNMLLRPLATFLSCCLIVATFGLFVLVINALLLAATAWVGGQLGLAFTVAGPWPAFWGALVISVVSLLATIVVRGNVRRI